LFFLPRLGGNEDKHGSYPHPSLCAFGDTSTALFYGPPGILLPINQLIFKELKKQANRSTGQIFNS
jgi:hypothetical protein